jgi:hypothetical protein
VTARTLAAAALVALVGTALAQPKPASSPTLPPTRADQKAEKGDPAKQLATRVSVQKFEGKFKDAVKMVAEAYDLPLVLTKRAEEWRDYGSDDETKLGDRLVALPRLNNVKVDTVLALLCEQTKTRFLVYPDTIRIVPDVVGWYEAGILTVATEPPAGDCDLPFLTREDIVRSKPLTKRALVNASFKSKTLTEAIDEIVESTGANVALSPLVPANVRLAPVTVRFANAPVDAAVRTLCEMTEAGVIEDANVLVVTTRERASARAKEDAQKVRDRHPPSQRAPGPGGVAPPALQPQPDFVGEVAKLKEQNEQLKAQLDQLEKLLKKAIEK